jgi:hypothetical protein
VKLAWDRRVDRVELGGVTDVDRRAHELNRRAAELLAVRRPHEPGSFRNR